MPYVERITRAGKTIEVERYFTSRYKKPGIKRGDKVKPTKEQTVELLAVEAARKNGNTGLLYRIYKYVEFKKGERRKHEKF